MVESCPKDSPGQQAQTLLEAAKEMSCQCTGHASTAQWDAAVAKLRAAIAREEAKASYVSEADVSDYWSDRAQQAEASAAWHKAESERLSAELAKEREYKEAFRDDLNGVRAALHAAPSETATGTAMFLRQRAEKAEAECSEQLARAESGEDRNRDLSEKLIAAHGRTHAESERAKKAEAELAQVKSSCGRWQTRAEEADTALAKSKDNAEHWRSRAKEAEAALAKAKSHPMDGGDITVMLNRAGVAAWGKLLPHGMTTTQRVECLIGEWKQLKVEVSNLERTRDALLDVMKKQKAEAMDAINLLAKVIGGDS